VLRARHEAAFRLWSAATVFTDAVTYGVGDRGRIAGGAVLALVVVAAGTWTVLHGVAGVSWREVATVLMAVPLRRLAVLAVIWGAGLGVYATVLSAALPGLGLRRGLLLNLSGSAVANVLPLGGAVATGLNWRMARRWGHTDSAFASFCLLTNGLDVVTKLLLPPAAVLGLVVMSVHVPRTLWAVVATCSVLAALLVVVSMLLLRPGRGPDGHGGRSRALRARLQGPVSRIRALLRTRWSQLLPGSVGYVAAQALLLLFSLHAVGLGPSLAVVGMAAAIERLGSLVPVTPAGTGVAEIGTVAWLIANGLDPVGVVAGVLLYRVFVVALEIPVGGLLLGAWAWLERRRTAMAVLPTGGPA
jgi:uncharacterized membrane protein YbhN (UPF0104 family)